MADTETPVTVFQKMQPFNPIYLLESVEGNQLTARYSFIGLSPFATLESNGLTSKYTLDNKEYLVEGKPLDILEEILAQFNCPKFSELPRFYGGAVGYIGYDVASTLENLPTSVEDDIQLPDTLLVFCEVVLIYDHLQHVLTAVVNSRVTSNASKEYSQAVKMLNEIENLLYKTSTLKMPTRQSAGPLESNCSKKQFTNAVKQAKEYITAGDIFQVVLSQRFSCSYTGSSFDVYRHMRSINPSPYMYYLKLNDICIAGASPEMLVRVENNEVQTRPIAGTRPRGKNVNQDNQLADDLLNDEKEKAEHVMLVDLGRNDIGKVCQPGTVKVDSFMQVEKYSHVMHLVSNVKGTLSPKNTAIDALKACFPAGTVSGAPKIRAMEIINQLETTKRGPYSGAIGYFGFNNVIDTAITIRTVVFYGEQAYFQAGAGIVADSEPETEFQESVNKAAAVTRSLGIKDGKGGIKRFAVGD
ncbi:MAG: anthranilate synthase component I [Firmicutes bacterium]|nr:anthranilate synthase component I [Bacillota bacterium]